MLLLSSSLNCPDDLLNRAARSFEIPARATCGGGGAYRSPAEHIMAADKQDSGIGEVALDATTTTPISEIISRNGNAPPRKNRGRELLLLKRNVAFALPSEVGTVKKSNAKSRARHPRHNSR